MLRPADFHGGVWQRFTAELDARLAELRELNDQVGHTNEKTSLIRGQISEVKRLLALRQRGASESAEPGPESWPLQPAA